MGRKSLKQKRAEERLYINPSSKQRTTYRYKITEEDRKYASTHKTTPHVIKYARGTVISGYKFYYKRRNKVLVSPVVVGQSTTSYGQTVATEWRGLVRNAYLDALISFKEAMGLEFGSGKGVIGGEHVATKIRYYGAGRTVGRITDHKVSEYVPDTVVFTKEQKQAKIRQIMKNNRAEDEKMETPISRRKSKRKQYKNPYDFTRGQ